MLGNAVQAFTDPCRIGSSYYCIRIVDVSREYGTAARLMVLDHLGHGVNLKASPRKLVSPYVELHDILPESILAARLHFVSSSSAAAPTRCPARGRQRGRTQRSRWLRSTLRSPVWRIPSCGSSAIARVKTLTADARVALQFSAKRSFRCHRRRCVPRHRYPGASGHRRVLLGWSVHRLKPDGLYLMNVVDESAKPAPCPVDLSHHDDGYGER